MCPGEPKFIRPYSINGSAITNRNNYKDLEVLMSSDVTWGAAEARDSMQDLSECQLHCWEENTLLVASMLQLMYCSPIWSSNLIKDILKLEKVQRHATLSATTSDHSTRSSDL